MKIKDVCLGSRMDIIAQISILFLYGGWAWGGGNAHMTFKSLGLTVMGLSPGSTFYPVALSELFLLYTGFIDPANQSRSTF